MMIKIIIGIVFIVHGIAHISGFLAAFTKNRQGFKESSWLINESVFYRGNIARIFGVFWLISMLILIAGGLSVLFEWPYAFPLMMMGCLLSALVMLPWLRTVPVGAMFGLGFDLLFLALCQLDWFVEWLHEVANIMI